MAARPTAGSTCSGWRRPDRPARHSSSATAPVRVGVGLTALQCVKPGEAVTEPAAFHPAMCRTRPGSDVVDRFTAPRASCPGNQVPEAAVRPELKFCPWGSMMLHLASGSGASPTHPMDPFRPDGKNDTDLTAASVHG
jgi:hypothetical protein